MDALITTQFTPAFTPMIPRHPTNSAAAPQHVLNGSKTPVALPGRQHQRRGGTMALLAMAAAAPAASATQIIWDLPLGGTHLTSAGNPMPPSFVFELGSFSIGFVPTAANMADWAANWKAASRAAYRSTVRYYSGVYDFSGNTAPFLPGVSAWVWGSSGSEWILFRKSSWTWPPGSSIGGPAMTWSTTGTVIAVAGSVSSSGNSLKSAAMPGLAVPPLYYADWHALHFNAAQQANPAVSSPGADADGDGMNNLLEYIHGSAPLSASSSGEDGMQPIVFTDSGQNYFGLRYTFQPRSRVVFTPWGSTSTAGPWQKEFFTELTSPDGEVNFRETLPMSAAPRSFLRLTMEPRTTP